MTLQKWCIVQRNNGEKPEERVIKLGEAVWDKLFEVYGVKPVFERKR